jgi:hypothetical protein
MGIYTSSVRGSRVMPLPVANGMADSQIFQVAAATLALRADVLQRCFRMCDMRTANPAGHHAVQLPGDRFVDLVAGQT